jgi:thiamine biosynthesis lipoprotein
MSDLLSTSFKALGTTAVVVVVHPGRSVDAVREVERELEDIDRTCSRFREDSDLSRVNGARGAWVDVDPLLVTAVEVALHAADVTEGAVDPTVGAALMSIGYDRDFAEVSPIGTSIGDAEPAPGWHVVEVDTERARIRVPAGVMLDLGATAKALAADRSAARAARTVDDGVMVSLGGDLSVDGSAPAGGWPVGIADDHRSTAEPGETIAIVSGGIATSSTSVRRWTRGGAPVHHIVDPRTGLPAREIWRTISVAASSCVGANNATTAAVVLGEEAPAWLASLGLPARLVRPDGRIVRVGGWPERAAA